MRTAQQAGISPVALADAGQAGPEVETDRAGWTRIRECEVLPEMIIWRRRPAVKALAADLLAELFPVLDQVAGIVQKQTEHGDDEKRGAGVGKKRRLHRCRH